MADLRKVLEAKKARILEAANRQVAEIDRDLSDLDRLEAKYDAEIEVARPVTLVVAATGTANGKAIVHGAARGNPNSTTSRSKTEAVAIIRKLGRPVPLSELYEKIAAVGVEIGGKNPKWVLSSYLGGASSPVVSTEKGWWLKGEPLP